MNQSFNYLFNYLEKESIYIDKTEFEFQVQSHPDYPSLLAINDTLSFFNIENLTAKVDKTQIELLPNRFVALLNEDWGNPQFYLVEIQNENYFLIKEKVKVLISKDKFEERWREIVLLVERSNFVDVIKTNRKTYNYFLFGFILIVFSCVLYRTKTLLQNSLFFIFPVIGILFSIAALKDLFGAKSKLINNFCSITKSTSCTNVIGSNKWKIFEVLNFSDLSMIFFGSQLIGLFLLTLSNNASTFFSIQKIFLLGSVPIVLASLYYQKNVEKKWCPICLIIIMVILIEIIFVFFVITSAYVFIFDAVVLFCFSFAFTIAIWGQLKKGLSKQKELKENLLKAIRFERNYGNFKNNLLAKSKSIFPLTPIILGNIESKTIITIISNPFCGHCKEAHEIIDSILKKHHNDLQVQIILKTNFDTENEESRKLFRSLIKIYMQDGEVIFKEALKKWFENRNLIKWFNLFNIDVTPEFDTIFHSQYKWCQENDYNFTPAIFVNGYEYPPMYDRKSFIFFINEIIEDDFY